MFKIKWSKSLPDWTKEFHKKAIIKIIPAWIVQILMLITLIFCIYLNWKNPSLPANNPYRNTTFAFIPLNIIWMPIGIRLSKSTDFFKDGNTIVCVYRGCATKGNLFVVNGKIVDKGKKDFSKLINNKNVHFHIGFWLTKVE